MKALLLLLTVLRMGQGKDCYWAGRPWCGFITNCGRDHFMWYGLTWSCLVSFDKYCCPSGKGGNDDIILCGDKEFNGGCIIQSFDGDKQCLDVEKNDWAMSVNTMAKCYRLYEDGGCRGKSVAVYPGSPDHYDLSLLGMGEKVSSVGQCYSEDRFYVCSRSKRAGEDKCRFAMDVLTVGFLAWRYRDRGNLTGPVRFYQRSDRNGRTEAMEALVERRHLNTGTATNNGAREYARRMGNQGDDAGHVLAARLGGSGTDLRNIFPQSSNINRGEWARAEGMVAQVVENYGSAIFNVNLEYENEDSTRPIQIVYRIARGDTGEVILINDMVNPD